MNNEKIKDLFAIKYELNFINWIEYDVADFKVYVFTVEQMKRALKLDLQFDNITY